MFPVVGNQLEGYSKAGYDMVKEKTHCSVSGVVESGHSFGPFGEVIHSDNNVFVTIAGGGITSHKVNAPFTKGACSNDRVKKSGGSSGFVGVELTSLTASHGMNAVMKQGRPKITSPDDLLGCGDAREMAPASAAVTVIDGANKVIATVPTGANPVSVAVNPVTNKIYVANNNSNSML